MILYTNFIWAMTGEPQEMAVSGGRVVFRRTPSPDRPVVREVVDLGGKYLLPDFVDAHCHILPTGLDLAKLHLGSAESKSDVLDLVRQRHREQPDGWLHAVHYDQNRYGGHLTRDDLDQISSDRPILLRHVNGHASVANSAALRAAGVDDTTPDPTGGEYVREGGRPNGVLLEDAHDHVTNSAPSPNLEQMVEAILLAGKEMKRYGIACATDMMTGTFDLALELEAYRLAAERGCAIDLRLYMHWKSVLGPRAVPAESLLPYMPWIRGVKIFCDGAIGSATAAIYGEYSGKEATGPLISSHGHPTSHGYRQTSGQLIYRPERLSEMVRVADRAGWSIAIHAIGDYATDLVMDAYAETDDPTRHRIEHAMLLSDEQIDRLAKLGSHVTFQPEFLARFGHSYRRQLGEERASMLKRTRSVLDAGIPLSFNSDRPIVSGDPWEGILIAESREGFDPSERCTRKEGIVAYSAAGSRANGDADEFGTLAPRAKAAFHLYEESPLTGVRPTPLVQDFPPQP